MKIQKPHLIITPSVPVWIEDESLVFDRKYYDGILLYIKMWAGQITCVMNTTDTEQPDFGLVKMKRYELPFDCVTLAKNEVVTSKHIKKANIVLASGDSFKQLHISKLCYTMNIKCVYIIENIPETRYQIVSMDTANYIIKLRRFIYVWLGERKRVSAFTLANGLQANGMPAYKKYKNLNDSILYYDNRVNKKITINNDELEKRLLNLSKIEPLQLVFSGRLIKIKGADHLVKLAAILKKKNLNFHLTIYGKGELEAEMNENIKKYNISDVVTLAGSVDFYNELIPNLKKNMDLFICLHRQSDPSCTYIETLSCGIPIVGYLNKAFSGLLEEADIGYGARLDDLDNIANLIENIDQNRNELKTKSRQSVEFARLHDFETTHKNRINQLTDMI